MLLLSTIYFGVDVYVLTFFLVIVCTLVTLAGWLVTAGEGREPVIIVRRLPPPHPSVHRRHPNFTPAHTSTIHVHTIHHTRHLRSLSLVGEFFLFLLSSPQAAVIHRPYIYIHIQHSPSTKCNIRTSIHHPPHPPSEFSPASETFFFVCVFSADTSCVL